MSSAVEVDVAGRARREREVDGRARARRPRRPRRAGRCPDTAATRASRRSSTLGIGRRRSSWVPLPWCASQSTISTRSPRSRSAAAVDRDVVQQAETHRAGRPPRGARAGAPRRTRRRPRRARAPRRLRGPRPPASERGLPRCRPTRAVSASSAPPPRAQNSLELDRGTRACAPARARLASRRGARAAATASRTSAGAEAVEHGAEPRRALGVRRGRDRAPRKRGSVATSSTVEATNRPLQGPHGRSSLRSRPVKAQTKAHSYRFRGGVVRVAAWHGRPDVASLALRGVRRPSHRALRAAARPVARGGISRGRDERGRDRARAFRSSTPASRCAAACTCSHTISPRRCGRAAARAARRGPTATRSSTVDACRVRRVLALRRLALARSHARDAARAHACRGRCSATSRRLRAVRPRRARPATSSGSRSRPDEPAPRARARAARRRLRWLQSARRDTRARQHAGGQRPALDLYLRAGFSGCRSACACWDAICERA